MPQRKKKSSTMRHTMQVPEEFMPKTAKSQSSTKSRDHAEILTSLKAFIKNPKFTRERIQARGMSNQSYLRYQKWAECLTHESRNLSVQYRKALLIRIYSIKSRYTQTEKGTEFAFRYVNRYAKNGEIVEVLDQTDGLQNAIVTVGERLGLENYNEMFNISTDVSKKSA